MGFSFDEWFRLLSTKNDVAAEKYRASFMPDYVYKFVSLFEKKTDDDIKKNKKRFNSLAENKVWYSLPEKLNDPYEMKGFYFDRDKLIENGYPKEAIDILTDLLMKTPVVSFTSNIENNLPMWAHYSNNHKGFAIKYKVNNKYSIRKVIYLEEIFDATKLFTHFLGYSGVIEKSQKNEDLKCILYLSSVLQMIFFSKHISWQYENEYRSLYLDEFIDPLVSAGLNVNAADVNLEPIAVYAGIKCSEEHKKRLQQISNTLGIEFYCCKQSDRYFTVIE